MIIYLGVIVTNLATFCPLSIIQPIRVRILAPFNSSCLICASAHNGFLSVRLGLALLFSTALRTFKLPLRRIGRSIAQCRTRSRTQQACYRRYRFFFRRAQPAAISLLVEVMADDGGCRFGFSCSQCSGQGVVAACVGNRRTHTVWARIWAASWPALS